VPKCMLDHRNTLTSLCQPIRQLKQSIDKFITHACGQCKLEELLCWVTPA
jgi:hypothetical protein